tara:strand:- start:183 stop:857 length:675 start_codon:yes stop_codon:yes gene_type:complete
MKTILTRGGIEFLAVFLGIALSLWVDDFREERELKERLNDDLIKIYNEVQANTANIEKIIDLNEKYLSDEEELLKILNKEIVFNFDETIELIADIRWPTYFGETTAYRSSVSSGRFNTSKNDTLVRQLSRLYEHFFVRLKLNGDILDQQAFEFSSMHSKALNKAIFKQSGIDTLSLTKYFFSKDFHNGLLGAYDVRKNYYLARLIDTKSQLNKVKSTYHKYYFN